MAVQLASNCDSTNSQSVLQLSPMPHPAVACAAHCAWHDTRAADGAPLSASLLLPHAATATISPSKQPKVLIVRM